MWAGLCKEVVLDCRNDGVDSVVDLAVWPCAKLVVCQCAVLFSVLCQSLNNYALKEFHYGAT